MKIVRLPLIVIFLAISGVLGWALSAAFNSSVIVQQASINEDGSRISELKQQIAELKNQIATIKSELPNGNQNNITVGDSHNVKVSAQTLSLVSQSAENNHVQSNSALNADAAGETKLSVGKSAYEKFITESVDISWAFENEKKLKEAFYTDANLQTKELQSVVCKSSSCEIKIHLENKDGQSEISNQIMSRLMQKDLGLFAPIIWAGYSEQEKTANFYIKTDGS
ncbi:MAG TPA: hypothetical protein PK002_10650 [Cellvibrio sp.]|nr:hypothetical protein [Cellvibrio sp.]